MSRLRAYGGAAVSVALLASLPVACGGRSDDTVVPQDADAASDGAADALPPGVAYMHNGTRCCAEGIDRQCCDGNEPCAKYGGFGKCTSLGGGYTNKDICVICCPGLRPITNLRLVDGACVAPSRPGSPNICAACGDGVCRFEDGESRCNCPEDCGY